MSTTRLILPPGFRERNSVYLSPLELEEERRNARLLSGWQARYFRTGGRTLANSRKRRCEEEFGDPPIKVEHDSGIQIVDDSGWVKANERRKRSMRRESPFAKQESELSSDTPSDERIYRPSYYSRSRRKRNAAPVHLRETQRGWETHRRRESPMRLTSPQVIIYTKPKRHREIGDTIQVLQPEIQPTTREIGDTIRVLQPDIRPATTRRGARSRHDTNPSRPKTRHEDPPAWSRVRPSQTSGSLQELLSKEQANRSHIENQHRQEIHGYGKMISQAAEASRALKKDRHPKGPQSEPTLQFPPSQPPKVLPPRPPDSLLKCSFPLHVYFTGHADLVPNPSDFLGDSHQFWHGVQHIAECASAAHSQLTVGACKALYKVLCTAEREQKNELAGSISGSSEKSKEANPPASDEKFPVRKSHNPRPTPSSAPTAAVAVNRLATPKRSSESHRLKELLRRRRQRDRITELVRHLALKFETPNRRKRRDA